MTFATSDNTAVSSLTGPIRRPYCQDINGVARVYTGRKEATSRKKIATRNLFATPACTKNRPNHKKPFTTHRPVCSLLMRKARATRSISKRHEPFSVLRRMFENQCQIFQLTTGSASGAKSRHLAEGGGGGARCVEKEQRAEARRRWGWRRG